MVLDPGSVVYTCLLVFEKLLSLSVPQFLEDEDGDRASIRAMCENYRDDKCKKLGAEINAL